MRGHGRSSNPSKTFRHNEAAAYIFALLDHLGIGTFKGLGVSGGGNVLLHMATSQPARVKSTVKNGRGGDIATPIVPNGDHVPIGGEKWPGFLKTAAIFLLND
jgi:pimeloyl-ACP methyl ester carboxylesterase